MSYRKKIDSAVKKEVKIANSLFDQGDLVSSFKHLERAHILAQPSSWQHLKTHWHMLFWAIKVLSIKEIIGQLMRCGGAISQFISGYYPEGNTGGANISPFISLPIPEDLQILIDQASQ